MPEYRARTAFRALAAIGGLLSVAPCAQAAGRIDLTGSGSSLAAPVFQAWAAKFKQAANVSVNYQALGSSAGVDQMKKRLVDFAGTDKPLSSESLSANGLYQFPGMTSAIAIIMNLPDIETGRLKLDGATLADIFAERITQWNDPAIQKLNPALKLPALPIGAVHRGDGSGTTWVFTSYLSLVSPSWRHDYGAGALVAWPGGAGGRGNDGVASLVRQTTGAIGYVEYAYAAHNALSFARLKNRAGSFVLPGLAGASAAADSADWDVPCDKLSVLDAPGVASWPITAVSFALVSRRAKNATKAQALRAFFEQSLTKGGGEEKDLGYVPLPERENRAILAHWPQ